MIIMPTADETNSEDELPDDAIVIRGGLMSRKDLIASVRKCFALKGVYGLTVWSFAGLTAQDIALQVKNLHVEGLNPLGHGQLRQSTARTIREPGSGGRTLVLKKTGREGHYTLTFQSEPTDADWDRLENMFGLPEPNPAAD